MICFYCSWL